jgi:hypothetical protein
VEDAAKDAGRAACFLPCLRPGVPESDGLTVAVSLPVEKRRAVLVKDPRNECDQPGVPGPHSFVAVEVRIWRSSSVK